LARALVPLGARVVLATDPWCVPALRAGLSACGLAADVGVVELEPLESGGPRMAYWHSFAVRAGTLTHLIALERVGPSHAGWSVNDLGLLSTPQDVDQFEKEVPEGARGRCYTMRGLDITDSMRPAHHLFAWARRGNPDIKTI